MDPLIAILCLFLIALLVNIPLGYVRQGTPKFSGAWFLWVHASIPLLIYLRLKLGTSPWLIPVTIALAVLGQIIGGKARARNMSEAERRKLAQIQDLRLPFKPGKTVPDDEVMVSLLNMGGPRTNTDVRDFLRRVFSDPILIRFPLSSILQDFFAWLLVTLRGNATAERYHLIGGGSPIYPSSEAQVKALQAELDRRGRRLKVTYSFNYAPPLPEDTVAEVQAAGRKYLLPLSLYPHYSLATTGSNIFYLKKAAQRAYPGLQFLPAPSYYRHPGYIQAFTDRIQEQLKPGEKLDDFYLLFSAHGLPLYFLTEGDPYPFQIAETAALILDKLGRADRWSLSYQSAVGPLQWLKPSTDDMLKTLAKEGIKKLLIVPIAFVNDHIETLCEIDIEYRKSAESDGITDFRMSRAIESHPDFIRALADSIADILPQEPASGTRLSN